MMKRFHLIGRRFITLLSALALLIGGGVLLRMPAQRLHNGELQAGLQQPPPPVTDRTDALTGRLFFFSLGGLRTLATEILAMDATDAWLKQDWPRARTRWEQITTLCPHRASYWARAARDMAKNAVAHVYSRKKLSEHERAILVQEYLDKAEQFYLQGIAANPNSLLLRLDLAGHYEDLARRPQFAKAVEAYREARRRGAAEMYDRWIFYNLCRIRGREQEAWELGRRLFLHKHHQAPSLCCLLFALQHRLNIPQEQRYSITRLFGSERRALKQLRQFRNNTLRFPTYGVEEYLQQHHP